MGIVMRMLLQALALAFVVALAPHGRAHAATFTPDMWVYGVVFDLNIPDGSSSFYATTIVPIGAEVPDGCTASPVGAFLQLGCRQNPGIDLRATVSQPARHSYLVGFNQTTIVCSSEVFGPCPQSTAIGRFDAPIDSPYYSVSAFNYLTGTLSMDGGFAQAKGASYSLSPNSVRGNAFTPGQLRGRWSLGFDGNWSIFSDDIDIYYTMTGSLVAAPVSLPVAPPTPVPLPAALSLMVLGLAAFGLVRRR